MIYLDFTVWYCLHDSRAKLHEIAPNSHYILSGGKQGRHLQGIFSGTIYLDNIFTLSKIICKYLLTFCVKETLPMSYSRKNARQRILDAATESFQSLGYARTTTQAIAAKAGVAEVTLFRHFGDKQTLFQEIVQQIGGGPNLDRVEAQLTYDLETDLWFIGQHALRYFLAQQDAIRMLMFEAMHFPEMNAALAQNPRSMIEVLARYFQTQMDAGKVQTVNPQVTAQAFLSMVFGYAVGMHPIKAQLPIEISEEAMTAEFVRVFLFSLRPIEQ